MILAPRSGLWTPGHRRPPNVIDLLDVSGASQLLRKITINGVTVDSATAGFLYDLTQATGATGSIAVAEWNGQAAGLLTEAGGGALTRGNAGPFSDGTTGGKGDGTGRLEAAGTSFGNIGTDDMVLCVVTRAVADGSAIPNLLCKRDSGTYFGWSLYENGNLYQFGIAISGAEVSAVAASGPADAVDVIVACVNRNEASTSGGYLFRNAVPGTGVDFSTTAASADSASKLTMFSFTDGALGRMFPGNVYAAAMWHAADWFSAGATGAAEMQAVASELTARVFGTYAALSRGSVQYPAVTRATTRYFQVGSVIHAVGAGGQCIEQDAAGRKFLGAYGARTNLLVQSQNLATTWAKEDAGDTVAATTITADATDGNHGVTQAVTLTAALYTFSAEAEPGAEGWFYLADSTVANCFAYFNAATGALGASPGANATPLLVGKRGDKYRFAIVFTGTAADHTFIAAPAHADGDRDFAGDGAAVSITITNAHVEVGSGPGPIIPTTTAAVTKNAEIVTRPVGAYSLPGTWEFIIRTWDTVPTNKRIFAWYDASTDAVIELYLTADGYVYQAVNNGAGATVGQSVAVAVNNGALHRVRASFSTNNCGLWVDGTVARDVSCAMPAVADLDVYAVGSGEGGNVFDGEIHEARFTPGVWA